jgi:hypothetical protein
MARKPRKSETEAVPKGAVEVDDKDLDQAAGGALSPDTAVEFTPEQDPPTAGEITGEQPPSLWILTKRI